MRLRQFSTLSFDCYGTLIDWETGIEAALRPWLENFGRRLTRDQILELFSRFEGPVQEQHPDMLYPEILAQVHHKIAAALDLAADDRAARAFGASVGDWPAFPDAPAALAYLKQHYRLVILSNIDRASFARSNERLEVTFDDILTAQDVGSYKPDPRNFQALLDHLGQQGIGKEELLHTAESLHHDHLPARRIGLATCWIHRRHAVGGFGATRVPESMVEPDFRFESMAAMVDAHRAESHA